MYKLLLIVGLLALLGVQQAGAFGEACAASRDCPDYVDGAVCHTAHCAGGECVEYVNDCGDKICSETHGGCVECISHRDCGGAVCDHESNTCRACVADEECPHGDWCHGGHWTCDLALGGCVAPAKETWPCGPDASVCDREAEQCVGVAGGAANEALGDAGANGVIADGYAYVQSLWDGWDWGWDSDSGDGSADGSADGNSTAVQTVAGADATDAGDVSADSHIGVVGWVFIVIGIILGLILILALVSWLMGPSRRSRRR